MRGEINKEMFQCIPEIDFNLGYRYFLGSMDNYSKALLSILKSIKVKIPILRMMYQHKEYEGLRVILQTMEKMLSNIGATELTELTYQLEELLLNKEDARLRTMLNSYINDIETFSIHLEQFLKKADLTVITNQSEHKSFLNYDFTKTRESIRRSNDILERRII